MLIFSFEKLCEENLSAIDYYQIVNVCDWIIIVNIPELAEKDRNKAKRFQILLDILYDKKIGLALSSNIKPEDIYIAGDGYMEYTVLHTTDKRQMIGLSTSANLDTGYF